MWKTGFANQRGETALQEENDQLGLNGVNCRNSLRVNCSTIELGTRRIWVAFGFLAGDHLILAGESTRVLAATVSKHSYDLAVVGGKRK